VDTTLNVRAAAVAGFFYPRGTSELSRTVQALLAEGAAGSPSHPPPKALLVPHAGYVYSGPVAASAYATLGRLRESIRRVVLLGPTHHVPVPGLALPGASAFETPLGRVQVDGEAAALLRALPQVGVHPRAHAQEHSLEVQLPFLQQVLRDFQLLPLTVGAASPEAVAEVLGLLWGGPETLLVVSSDLSHYLPYEVAQRMDRQTCDQIADLELLTHHEQACGAAAINGLLVAARRHGLKAHLLDLRNSGDTAGDHGRVVGYAAFAFTPAPAHEH
jgi:hypothetical protein